MLHATPALAALVALAPRAAVPAEPARHVFVDAREARAVRHPSAVRELARGPVYAVGAAVIDGRVLAALVLPGAAAAFRDRPTPFASRAILLQGLGRPEPVALIGAEIVAVGVLPTGATKGTVLFEDAEIAVWEVERTLAKVEAVSRRRRPRSEQTDVPASRDSSRRT